MNEYRAIYKCRLCGEEFEGMIFGERDSVSCAMALFTSGNDSYAMRYKEPPNILYTKEEHYCKDGSMGLADFLGFRKVEDGNESD